MKRLIDVMMLEAAISDESILTENIDTKGADVGDESSPQNDSGITNPEMNSGEDKIVTEESDSQDQDTNDSKLSEVDLETLEEDIDEDYMSISESIINVFYDASRGLMMSSIRLESLATDAIVKQKNILTESGLTGQKYIDDMDVLIEATGNGILYTIIEAIKRFIQKVKEFLRKIGIDISISFVNYERWATSKEASLLEDAKKFGDKVRVELYTWDTDYIFKEEVDFSSIHRMANDYVKWTTSREEMENIIPDLMVKYKDVAELRNDVYCHALALAAKGNPDDRKFTDKLLAQSSFVAKFKYNKKPKFMTLKRTVNFISELKQIRTNTSSNINKMRNTFINPDFEALLKETEREYRSREVKSSSTKYKYFRLRFEVLSAIQDACDDIYKMKITLMKEYAREIYNSLKVLDGHNTEKETKTEAVSIGPEIVGYTLHE